MALLFWLPMTDGTLKNQGLSDVQPTNHGATVNNSGKLGKCYDFAGTTSQYIDTGFKESFGTGDFTITAWFKLTDSGSRTYQPIISNKAAGAISVGVAIYYNHSQQKFLWSTADGTSATEIWMANTFSYSSNLNTWHHIAMVRNSSDSKIGYFYIDGVRYELASVPPIRNVTNNTNNMFIGSIIAPTTNYMWTGSLCDIRIYDKALSHREVKEISKGKILHYTLSDSYNLSNIIYNGFGEYGASGWSGTTVSTSDLPSDTAVKAVFTGGQTAERIPINPNNTYALSCYVKSSGATSGTTYPSILPYDIDGNFISVYQCREGFRTTWQATLTQPLNKGDTVVHCSDLSNWSTATNNHFYYVAIFGYKDSYGNVYPDFEYTHDSLSFGSYSDKSNLNKTNNTITLKSAYTGEPRPAGTKVCQATVGSTYYYPFGGLALASLQDWTHKTATLNIKNIDRLKYAKSIIWLNYSGGKYAGIKMTDTTWGTNIVYDVSGFCNNGEAYTTDGTGQFLTEPDSPRYDIACNIHSLNSTKSAYAGTAYILGNCALTNPTVMTIAFWGYLRNAGYNGNSRQGIFCTTMGDGTDYLTSAMNQYDEYIRINDLNGNGDMSPISSFFVPNEWHHYCIVYNGSVLRLYRDGTYVTSKGFSSAVALGSFNYVMIGFSKAGGVWRRNNNSYSDFRVYATALSADDVLELYHTPITLSSNGTLLTQGEYVEV